MSVGWTLMTLTSRWSRTSFEVEVTMVPTQKNMWVGFVIQIRWGQVVYGSELIESDSGLCGNCMFRRISTVLIRKVYWWSGVRWDVIIGGGVGIYRVCRYNLISVIMGSHPTGVGAVLRDWVEDRMGNWRRILNAKDSLRLRWSCSSNISAVDDSDVGVVDWVGYCCPWAVWNLERFFRIVSSFRYTFYVVILKIVRSKIFSYI